MHDYDLHVVPLTLPEIFVVGERRPIDAIVVEKIAKSIEKIGLQYPITVRRVDSLIDPTDGEEVEGAFVLITGLHRLEAVRSLGHEAIDCIIKKWDETESRLWEISENLHRSDLTVLQRSEQIAEWVKLTEKKIRENRNKEVSTQVESKRNQGGRPEGGQRAAARELGLDLNEVQRSLKIAEADPEAKEAAKAAGLDKFQSALLKVAAAGSPEQQVATVHQIATARKRAADAPIDSRLTPAPTSKREQWIADGVKWWEKGEPEWREEFDRLIKNLTNKRAI